MKKIIALLLLLSVCVLPLVSCTEPDNTKIRVGYLAGPTGMGMAKLIHDNGGAETGNEKYSFEKFPNTEKAKAALTAGQVAAYYNTTDDNLVVLAINTLNTLYVLSDANNTVQSFADLAGKTVYTCSDGTPSEILTFLLKTAKVDATVATEFEGKAIKTPADLGALVTNGSLPIAVVPEPMVTSSTLKNTSYSVDVNISDVWAANCDTPLTMGCIVASKTFVDEHKSVVKSFLAEYKESIQFIDDKNNIDTAAKYVVETGVMNAEPAAKKALTNLTGAIRYIDGKDMKDALEAFYKAVGVSSPKKDAFYY